MKESTRGCCDLVILEITTILFKRNITGTSMDVAFQTNGNECGLYGIANSIVEASGNDPCTQD